MIAGFSVLKKLRFWARTKQQNDLVRDGRDLEIDTIEVELIELIRNWAGSRQPITPQSAFYQDLYVVGDDLDELFGGIAKRYGTSFAGFRFDIYVPDESRALFYFWAMRLGFCRNSFPRFTVAHLAAVIQRGQWFEPSELQPDGP